MNRIDFSPSVIREIAQKAMYVCSNPYCLRFTGYSTSEGKARSIAEGAHINAASKNGPRPDSNLTDESLKASGNGIWLCKICHNKIDDDTEKYTTEELKKWKKNHENIIRNIVGLDLESALLNLQNVKRNHAEVRELLSFLESRRVMYEGLDIEFPPHVFESLTLIRERIALTRSRVNPDTEVFVALNKLQDAIVRFFRNIGTDTDLKTLRCDSRDPKWLLFKDELEQLRKGMFIILKVLSGDANYTTTYY